ncbi:MAG: RnfABCDGE type electron transport complex subunit D, partial [Prevotellaceae bacterium]|nr:RnfABCDGE type electron transport complex subunit D [Prevotellaceae bacterium]
MSKLIISLSPHVHGGDSVERNMYNVVIALVPALLVSLFYFGVGSLVVCAVSVAACMFFEWAISRYLLHRAPTLTDGSALITGLLLGMNLPSNFPVWMVIVGALVAIGIGKMTFGG